MALLVSTMPKKWRGGMLWVGTAAYCTLTLAVFVQALAGRPFLPGLMGG